MFIKSARPYTHTHFFTIFNIQSYFKFNLKKINDFIELAFY